MSNFNFHELVSRHLGKTTAGETMTAYQTPTTKDADLLVALPRIYNRETYNITDECDIGYDTWNCYETTFLLQNGFPVTGITVINYPSDSENIIESKSLKLYLNSFNMMRFDSDSIRDDAVYMFESEVETDLATALETEVSVQFIPTSQAIPIFPITQKQFITLEEMCDVSKLDFSAVTETPELLQAVPLSSVMQQRYHSAVLRSNCRVTNQPDFGDVFIHIRGMTAVDNDTLLQYLVSFRNENHFHEEVCEMIYKRLWDLLKPEELFVQCNYTRRGGIDINPVRASSIDLVHDLTNMSYARTMRQ
jgi:7-cyano-7-deazaguanine reductase